MTERLIKSIENLYKTFSKYHGNANMQGSSNYDDLDNWNKLLFSKKLKDLTEEDLSLFAGKVITTWGDENDLRHFLPRMLELTAEYTTPYDIWILYSKVDEADWKNWPLVEQSTINEFTLSLWDNLINDNSEKAEEAFNDYFHAIAYFYDDFSEILRIWEANSTFSSMKHLTRYIYNERENIFDKHFLNSHERNTKDIGAFKDWLLSEKMLKKIEEAFYEFEKDDIGERISWVEKILNDEKKQSI